MKSKIYYLHKGDNIPFYIGKTNDPQGRLRQHRFKMGEVKLEVISEVKDWKRWERYYIKKYTNLGYNLINKNEGGGGATFFTQKQKDNISKAKKGIVFTQEHIDKLSAAKKGKCYNNTKGPRNKVAFRVIQRTLTGVFIKCWDGGANEAQRAINGKRQGSVRDCCRGKCKTAYGYKFSYEQKNT